MTEPDVLLDTSAAVALVVRAHERHASTMEAMERLLLGLAGHAWFETFSVLTRLPAPARRSPAEVTTILRHDFPESRFLAADATAELTGRLGESGIGGGSVYDALVGFTAIQHDLPLVTRDRRAVGTYRTLGVDLRLLP